MSKSNTINQIPILLLFLITCVILGSCTEFKADKIQTDSFDAKYPKTQETPSTEQNNIISKDYLIAEKSLKKAVLEKDKKTLKVGLRSSFLTIRQKIVEAIIELNDKTFVADLIESLQANQIILDGGTETQIEQSELDRTIIRGLESLTKIDFKVSKELSIENIAEIIKRSQDWLEIYQKGTQKH
jgi:hypothetical protein